MMFGVRKNAQKLRFGGGGGDKSYSTICQVRFTLKLDYDLRGVNRTVRFAKYDLPSNQILMWGVNRTV